MTSVNQLQLEQQQDMLELECERQAEIREDIMKACLLGGEYTNALVSGHPLEANDIMHQVTQLVNKYILDV